VDGFKFDVSKINLLELKELDIRLTEIESVFKNQYSAYKRFDGFEYLIGFSSRRKFIHLAFREHPSLEYDYELLQIDLPYEEDIRKYYC